LIICTQQTSQLYIIKNKMFLDLFCYSLIVGKPEGKRSLGCPRCRWVDNIKMDLKETGWGGMDWIDLAQDRDQ
jgi:hypothetical protein